MKKFIAILLSLTFVITLFGCDSTPDPSTSTKNPTTTTLGGVTNATEPDATWPALTYPIDLWEGDGRPSDNPFSLVTLPADVDNPEQLPVLKWVCIQDYQEDWDETPVIELNEMLKERGMPFRLQLTVITEPTALQCREDWLNTPMIQGLLSDTDIITGYMPVNTIPEMFLNITDYAVGEAEPTLKNAVPHERNWITTTIDGEIYGISTNPDHPNSAGWCIDTQFLEKCGLEAEDFYGKNYWEMDEIFEEIFRANNNMPFLLVDYVGAGIYWTQHQICVALPATIGDYIERHEYQPIGVTYAIDLRADTPTVVNLLETDTTRKMLDAMNRYQKAGYTDNHPDRVKMRYGNAIGSGIVTMDGMTYIPVTDSRIIGSAQEYVGITGITSTSENREAALKLLNLIAEDEEVRTQLCYGKEGREYTVENGEFVPLKSNGFYCLSYSYNNRFNGIFTTAEFLFDRGNRRYPAEEGKTTFQTYVDNMENVQYCYYPIIFNYSGFEEILKKIETIMNENYNMIGNPACYTEARYEQMLNEMKAAGSDMIIAELQRQLDAWTAEHPDWNPLGK